MAELALTLYLIGFAATATSPLDDPRLAETRLWLSLAIGIAWPPFALLVVIGRFWRLIRG